jgi:hypothetical protein
MPSPFGKRESKKAASLAGGYKRPNDNQMTFTL